MFTAKVFQLLVRSTGNIMEESHTALREIEEWNANFGAEKGKVFIPVDRKKDPIVLQEVDIIVGIIGSFIRDAEFFKEAVRAGKKVFLFFSTAYDNNNSMLSEIQDVEAFKKQMESQCSCVSYNDSTFFIDSLLSILNVV